MKVVKVCALAALLVSLAGCGASSGAPPTRMDTIVDEAAGTQLMVLRRPTRGRVWLSLWIDAGARDADPPQVATVAGWIAAPEGVSVEVLPDGIELARACRREELQACLASLRTAVSTRDPSATEVAEARRRLVATRRRVNADESRRADALALGALLGEPADPLGDPADDPRVTERAVAAFLQAHAGAGRLLLVAVGDVDPRALREQVTALFGGIPRASARRAIRESAPASAVRIEVGDEPIVAGATLRPSVPDAALRARTLVARVAADAPATRVSADVFPLRGGAALIARTRGDGSVLLDHLADVAAEPPADDEEAPVPGEGPRALARWLGARWVARQEQSLHGGTGVGAIVAGGRGDRMGERDPDAALREEARAALEDKLRAAGDHALGPGVVDEERADVELAGGGRLLVRRLGGASSVSAVTLFSGGAAEDSPDAHGTTALLAEAARVSCERVAQGEIGSPLSALGIRVDAVLDPGAWGLSLEGPQRRWREVAFLATRCASIPYLDPPTVERARSSLLARVERSREAALATAARTMAPSAPGRIAPLGGTRALSRIDLRQLRRARALQVVSARARVAFAGDVAVDDVARTLSRGAARWPEGTPPEPDPWPDPRARLAAEHHPEGGFEALVGWVVDAPEGSELAASTFARKALRALSGEPGLRARWHEAGASGGRAWALVSLDATPDALDVLPAHVTRALSTVAWAEAAGEALREAEERRAWAESSPRGVARILASGDPEPPSTSEVRRVLSDLHGSSPFFVILRPQPGRR